MEAAWYMARYRLRQLRQDHPEWSKAQLSRELGYSHSWVKKWCGRLDQAEPDDEQVLHGQSRRRKQEADPLHPAVVKAILTIRDDPPENLKRIPGPVTIKYYLHKDEELQEQGYQLPSSTSTIWRVLDQYNRIDRPRPSDHTPLTRAGPLEKWGIDFKDVGSVPPQAEGKKQHVVETLNIVDSGTSILLDNPAREDFNAETTIEALIDAFGRWGLPDTLTFDRDPRFIGSWRADEFPSPPMQLLLNLGIELDLIPPKQPWKNPYVERYNRTYEHEGVRVYLPDTLQQTQEMNRDIRHHYNYERPNQALSCSNQPPRQAFPDLPQLPQLPQQIDPDAWLKEVDGQLFKRKVKADGTVQIGKQRYYISRTLKRQQVYLKVDAANQQLLVLLEGQAEPFKTLPIKGLHGGSMPFSRYLALIKAEAVSDRRRYQSRARRYLPLAV